MFGLGVPELMVILVIALVIFGPSKLPQIGSGLGKAIRDFKKGVTEKEDEEADAKKDGKDLPRQSRSAKLQPFLRRAPSSAIVRRREIPTRLSISNPDRSASGPKTALISRWTVVPTLSDRARDNLCVDCLEFAHVVKPV